MASMKALKLFREKGKVEIVQVPKPEDLGPNDVRIRVQFCGVCGTDLHIMAGEFPAAEEVIMGHEISGIVDKFGKDVAGLKQGDHVAVCTVRHCGSCK